MRAYISPKNFSSKYSALYPQYPNYPTYPHFDGKAKNEDNELNEVKGRYREKDEVGRDYWKKKEGEQFKTPAPTDRQEVGLTTILILDDLPEFVDYSGKDWKDGIKKGSILSMEDRTAGLLIEKSKAKLLNGAQNNDVLDRQAKEAAADKIKKRGLEDEGEKEGICEWCGELRMVKLIKGSFACRKCAPDVLKRGT